MTELYPHSAVSVKEQLSGSVSPLAASGSRARITCEPRVANNLDTLKMSLWVDWSNSSFLDRLEATKLKAQEDNVDSIPIDLAGYDWNCMRNGIKNYSFHLKRGDVDILFNRHKFSSDFANVKFEIGSQSCWIPGYSSVYENIILMINLFGGSVSKERVSEFHIAADFIGTSIENLPIKHPDRWITRAHTFSVNYDRGKHTGITVGKDGNMLRIYDKVQELKTKSTSKQPTFKEVWKVNEYDEHPVTRIEFQIRRKSKTFKRFSPQINTLEDLKNCLLSVWQHYTTEWSRLAESAVDKENNHQSRAKTHSFWKFVQNITWLGDILLTKKKIYHIRDLEKIQSQLVGLVQTVAAIFDREEDDIEGIISFGHGFIESGLRSLFHNKNEFIKRMKRKKNASLCPFLNPQPLAMAH